MVLQIVDDFSVTQKEEHLAGDYLNHPLNGHDFFESPKLHWESLHPIIALVELYYITGDDQYHEAFEKT